MDLAFELGDQLILSYPLHMNYTSFLPQNNKVEAPRKGHSEEITLIYLGIPKLCPLSCHGNMPLIDQGVDTA